MPETEKSDAAQAKRDVASQSLLEKFASSPIKRRRQRTTW